MADLTDERRRTRRYAVVGGAVVVVVAVVAGLWVLLSRQDRPDDPGRAAEQWADAVIAHRSDDARALECRPGMEKVVDTVLLTVTSADGVDAGTVSRVGSGEWRVELRVRPGGTTTFSVPVVRRDGRYLVCG